MRWDRVYLVAIKELQDTLRDRRTLLMMVLVPALLYPLGGVAITSITASTLARIDRAGYDVAVQGPRSEAVEKAVARDRGLSLKAVPDAAAAVRRSPQPAAVGLVVREVMPKGEAALGASRAQTFIEILYDSSSHRSRGGLERLRKVLDAEARAQRAARLRELHIGDAAITPIKLEERSVTSESKTVLAHLAPAIGILLILLSLMGAFYPAIDLVAGERERGTLEPLLATPTSRLELLGGKYFCLAVLALLTCVLNLASLALTTGFMLQKVAGPTLALHPGVLLLLLLATIPVLLLVSALLLLAAVFARSFKDAQNLMTPVYMACLIPALGGLVPETRLTSGTALVPVLSAVLFIKEALSGTLQLLPGFISVAAGLLYAALGIALAAGVFDRPEIIGTRTIDEGLSSLVARVGRDGRRVSTLTGALGVFGICLALMIHVGPRLQMANLRLGLLVTEIGLLLLPVLLYLRVAGVPVAEALGIRRVSARQVIGAGVAGIGGFALSLLLSIIVIERLLRPPEEYLKALQAIAPRGGTDTVVVLVIAALLPAICEEALCRGLVLQSARRTVGAPFAIVLSGFAFAILHLDPYRFLNTLALGCLLSTAAVLSGSIVPAMIMHFVNNASALLLDKQLERGLQATGLTVYAALLGTAVACLAIGLWLVRRRER